MARERLPRRQSLQRADTTASGPADGCLDPPPVGTEVIYSVSEVEEEKEEKLLGGNRVRENMAGRGDMSPAVESK